MDVILYQGITSIFTIHYLEKHCKLAPPHPHQRSRAGVHLRDSEIQVEARLERGYFTIDLYRIAVCNHVILYDIHVVQRF